MSSLEELRSQATSLTKSVSQAIEQLGIDRLEQQLQKIDQTTQSPDFWRDVQKAQSVMKDRTKLEARVKPWRELQQDLVDIAEMLAVADESLLSDLSKQLASLKSKYEAVRRELRYSGAYDDHTAIISIFAGAGGTDAQDWASMLLRMYVRWAEKHGLEARSFSESPGDEAGIKSATLEIDGSFAYGQLKGEHGVHRLVRLSPFNADHLRQTSFAKVEVLPKIEKPDELAIDEKDLRVDVFRSGGHGGQSVNTTDSAVRVTHLPTGISVAIQNERSQLQNKETAMTILRSRLAQLQVEQHAKQLAELKGPNQSAEWGNQIRSYVLHPYKQVKDLRTKHESSDPDKVLAGDLDPFIDAYLEEAVETIG